MPTFVRSLLALTLIAGGLVSVEAAPWPRFRGPNGDGIAQGQNIPSEFDARKNVLWKTRIPGSGNSSPIVWGEHIFLQTATPKADERLLVCLDARNGNVRWQKGIPGANVKLSRPDTSHASASAAVDGQAVYIPFWDGGNVHLYAYTFEGDLLWSRNLGSWISQHGPGSSPIIVGDKLIFAFDMDIKDMQGNPLAGTRPPMLMAFHKKTGDIAWETPREGFRACYSAPFLHERNGRPELIVGSTMAISAYHPDTGKQLWTWDWGWKQAKFKMPLRTVADPLVVGDMLIASSGDGGGDRRMVALTLPKNGTGAPKYAWGDGNKVFPYVPCPLARGEHVYFVNDRGFAACYHAKSGKQVWYQRLEGGTFLSSPVLIDGMIFAPSQEGDVFVLDAEPTYRLVAKNAIGERFVATPAVADGRMYLRGQNHLFCIGKK